MNGYPSKRPTQGGLSLMTRAIAQYPFKGLNTKADRSSPAFSNIFSNICLIDAHYLRNLSCSLNSPFFVEKEE